MVIFHSYVSLPEGTHPQIVLGLDISLADHFNILAVVAAPSHPHPSVTGGKWRSKLLLEKADDVSLGDHSEHADTTR